MIERNERVDNERERDESNVRSLYEEGFVINSYLADLWHTVLQPTTLQPFLQRFTTSALVLEVYLDE